MGRVYSRVVLVVLATVAGLAPNLMQAAAGRGTSQSAQTAETLSWQCSAYWRHDLKKTSGVLALTNRGVEFQPAKGQRLYWSMDEIQTFKLSPHHLNLTGYQNRKWRLHGERSFRFDLKPAVPPEVAAQLAARIGKPVENADPSATAPAFATLGARHRTFGGGTNGVLRFRKGGIDYVTTGGRGSRSWRWSDIQTIANPDPYHFRVQGYRETFEFELKQPMSRRLFDRLWDAVYARGLEGLAYSERRQP
jgi:hypothetical protein